MLVYCKGQRGKRTYNRKIKLLFKYLENNGLDLAWVGFAGNAILLVFHLMWANNYAGTTTVMLG